MRVRILCREHQKAQKINVIVLTEVENAPTNVKNIDV